MHDWSFSAVVLATIVITNVFAFLRRGKADFRTYSADPNRHGGWAIGLSMIGTIVGGGMFLAVGQIGFEAGVIGYVFGAASLVGLIVVSAFVPRVRQAMTKEGADTLIDLLEKRFSGRVAVIFSFVSGCMYFFLLAGQFVALYMFGNFAASLTSHQWVPWALVGCGAVSMLVYPIIGGLRKDILTDMFQVGLIAVTVGVLVVFFAADPTAQDMWQKLPPKHLSGMGYGPVFLFGVLLFVPGLFLVRMDVWQRLRAGTDDRSVSRAMIGAGVGALVFYVVFTSLGMCAYASGVKSAGTATLVVVVKALSNPVLLGVVIGAFFAAVLSSADTFINNTSIFLTRLVRGGLWSTRDNASAEQGVLLLWSRGFAVVSLLAGAGLAWVARDFVNLLVGAFTLLLMFLPTLLATFVESWRDERAAFYSALVSFLSFIPLFFLWDPKRAFAPSVALSFLVYAVLCSLGKRRERQRAAVR